ncbi:MAG: SEL1-like repeat protein [Pontiellaceae bacterium]|nr:SEL1-like repeat protein [Pontiellaceae bacterium]MBN2785613.1 SEL1-like repeat protein [Pontiellaceae bacterium]
MKRQECVRVVSIVLGIAGMLIGGCSTTPEPMVISPVEAWGEQQDQAEKIYQNAMAYLTGGRQADAERVIYEGCEAYPDAQRLLFLRGILLRSRFEMNGACSSFAEAYRISPENLPGRASNIVVSMDLGTGIQTGFDKLEELIERYPEESLLRWLYVIEAVSRKAHAAEAISQCEILLKEWKVAPVTLYKGYANLLAAGENQPEKALEYRMRAAELEPTDKNYEGVARTYEMLGRYADAEGVYAKMTEIAPDQAIRWFQWGNCLAYMGDFKAAAEKFETAAALDESEVISLVCWGRCLEKLGHPEEGFKKYLAAVKLRPLDQQVAAYVAHGALYGYGTACNFEAALKASANQGRPAIDVLRDRVAMADGSDNPLAPARSDVLLKNLIEMAENGDAEAQYSLSMIYKNGIGIEPDAAKAKEWLNRAAENGHAIAQRILNPPEQSTDAAVPAELKRGDAAIQGTWTSDQSVAVYEYKIADGMLQVRGYSSYSGKEMVIGDVQWDGTVLRFTSYMPASDHKVVHENRLVDDQTMTSTIVGSEGSSVIWKKKAVE